MKTSRSASVAAGYLQHLLFFDKDVEMFDYGSEELNCEDAIVYCLLYQHRLEKCRAKWMIQDQESMLRRKEDNERPLTTESVRIAEIKATKQIPLTLRAFPSFFPGFLVVLKSCCFGKGSLKELTIEKLVARLDRTPLIREYDEALQNEQALRHNLSNREGDKRPVAVIFHWEYLKARESFVVHNTLPVTTDVPGAYYVWTRKNGQTLVLETLAVFMEGVDIRCSPDSWLETAIRDGWDEEVSHAH